jgi:hypothetical protein
MAGWEAGIRGVSEQGQHRHWVPLKRHTMVQYVADA